MESLLLVVEKLKSVDSDIVVLEDRLEVLNLGTEWSITDIQECDGKILELVTAVDEFTEWNDSITTNNDEEQVVKKEVESRTDSFSARLDELTHDLSGKRSIAAEKLKNLGNDEFKRGKFPAALALYEEAIVYDSTNAVLYTNRALVFQKIDRWTEALRDAEHAVSLDADMLKGHIILIKCLVSTVQPTYYLNFSQLTCFPVISVIDLSNITAHSIAICQNSIISDNSLIPISHYHSSLLNSPENH